MESPRLSSTVLLLRDHPFEVLLIRRPTQGTFASALVFPGGAVDPADGPADDERTLRVAAARETWEEVGVRLHPDDLQHFAHWITPIAAARRFNTHFFLAHMPGDQSERADGVEALTAEWVSPTAAVEGHLDGREPMLFPTLLNLMRLAESTSVDGAIADARSRPRFTVQPMIDSEQVIHIPAEAGYPVTSSDQM